MWRVLCRQVAREYQSSPWDIFTSTVMARVTINSARRLGDATDGIVTCGESVAREGEGSIPECAKKRCFAQAGAHDAHLTLGADENRYWFNGNER